MTAIIKHGNVNIIEKGVGFEDSPDGLVIRESQWLPDDYIAQLKRDKIDTLHEPMGDFYKVAEIPTAIVDEWMAEGFDVFREPLDEIMKRLNQRSLDAFISTNKRIY